MGEQLHRSRQICESEEKSAQEIEDTDCNQQNEPLLRYFFIPEDQADRNKVHKKRGPHTDQNVPKFAYF